LHGRLYQGGHHLHLVELSAHLPGDWAGLFDCRGCSILKARDLGHDCRETPRLVLFFNIGVYNFYNFIVHAFFGKMAAAFTGWADSPFQFEVATASLGFSVVGFIAAFRSFDLRLAAIIAPGVFTLGDAVGMSAR
jgi:Family of unknown function (DUF6790)